MRNLLRNETGFTLLEMVIAVLIVSIMVAVATPQLTGISKRAEQTACAENQDTIRAALAEYHLIHHAYPTGDSAAQLQTLVDDGELQSVPKEPAGGTYVITETNDTVTVSCSVPWHAGEWIMRFRHRQSDGGFSLLEMAIAVWLTALSAAVAVPAWVHFGNRQALLDSSESLLWAMRSAQTWAMAHDTSATVDLNPYQPSYFIYHGTTLIDFQQFIPPVNYVDGYLHMPNHRVSYGSSGASDVMGVITLTDGQEKTAITLYRGGGLQTITGDGVS